MLHFDIFSALCSHSSGAVLCWAHCYFSEWKPDRLRAPTSWEERLLFPAPSPRGPPSPPITSLSAGKRAIQFLKAAVSVLRGYFVKESSSKPEHLKNRNSKASQHCSLQVFLFSFLLNVNSHVSLSPSIFRVSAYIQNRHHSVITSFSNATNNTFVYIYSQTERTVDGGRYLFIKRWVKDRFTLGMWSNYCPELPTKCLGI